MGEVYLAQDTFELGRTVAWSLDLHAHVRDWTPDGKSLIFETASPQTYNDIWRLAPSESEAGTTKLNSSSLAGEMPTGILPRTTEAVINQGTGPTTVLQAQPLTHRKQPELLRRKSLILMAFLVTAAIAAVCAVVVNSYLSRKRERAIQSIAVMPFINESGNADVEYLSDGMTETLIASLAQLPNLLVKARSTAFYYKGKETSAKKIGDELDVQAVLLGRVVQRGAT